MFPYVMIVQLKRGSDSRGRYAELVALLSSGAKVVLRSAQGL